MKPGKRDIRYKIRIEGVELAVLHKLTGQMCEAFGLDRKIDAYKGTRAITLYSWDLDCALKRWCIAPCAIPPARGLRVSENWRRY